ncbi:unnamed protein product [Calypogeia fissa]
MDPPLKLFGQTIAFNTSASSHQDALDGVGTTSSGAWEELSSAPQDRTESGAESVAKSELAHAEVPSGCCPEISSSGSNGADEEKISSSPRDVFGLALPLEEASKGRESEGVEDLDVDEGVFRQGDEANGDDAGGKGAKMPRRPDKAVACPRCHSLETKFCYYNNYNVNQPRHFCKHCQRYWTAGGTLRNVPVGAGRRKNKHGSVVSPRQTPDMGLVRGDEPDVAAPLLVGKGVPLPVPLQVPVVQTVLGGSLPCSPKPIIRVPVGGGSTDGVNSLPYGMRVPSLEGTYILASAEVVKPSEAGGIAGSSLPRVSTTSGFSDVGRGPSEAEGTCGWPSKDGSACASASGPGGSNLLPSVKGESAASPKHISDSDVTQAWSSGGAGGVRSSHGAPGSFGFFNGGWPYGYNVGWSVGAAFCTGGVPSVGNAMPPPTPASVAAWNGAAAGNMWTGVPWPMPGLSWSPAGWGPPPWPIAPWALNPAAAVGRSPSIPTGGASGVPSPVPCPIGTQGSSALGKHGRPFEGGGSASDGTVWAPKSLRMADPEEAMRSSVWRILGVGSHPELMPASTFKAFQPKSDSKKAPDGDQQTVQTTLHANPAAMSRSMYFQESN